MKHNSKIKKKTKDMYFGIMVQVNINRYFSPNFLQYRDLRQGDPFLPSYLIWH